MGINEGHSPDGNGSLCTACAEPHWVTAAKLADALDNGHRLAHALPPTHAGMETITIPAMDLRRVRFRIVGLTPYVSQAWSERRVAEIEARQSTAARGRPRKSGRDPEKDFRESIHHTPDGHPGVPAAAFKSCAYAAAPMVDLERTRVKTVRVESQGGVVPIVGSEPRMRRDMRPLTNGHMDPVYRAEYFPWRVRLAVVFNAALLSAAQIVNLYRVAGFHIGVGEGRPGSKRGSCALDLGTFDVAMDEDLVEEPFQSVSF